MAEKYVKTRVLQKIDSAANWKSHNPILKNGELAVVLLSAEEAEKLNGVKSPLVLFKIGNGNDHFEDLPYASGLASDVYNWAKASSKPAYAKSEVGLGNVDNVKQYSASNKPAVADVDGLQAALDKKQNKVSAIVLTAESGELSEEQLRIIKAEPSVKIIVNNIIFRLSVKNTIDQKYIYCATKTLEGTKVSNVKLDLNLNTRQYAITVFETAAVEELQQKVSTLETTTSEMDSKIDSHISNKDVHLQTGERAKWNNKVSCAVEAGTENDFILKLETSK